MQYEEAKEYLFNTNFDSTTILKVHEILRDDNINEGLAFIRKTCNCDENTAKMLWVDLKCEIPNEENIWTKLEKSGEENRKAEEIRKAREEVKYYGNAECPYCHSKNTKKISGVSRVASVGFFGFASKKIGKQWHCNKCGSNF